MGKLKKCSACGREFMSDQTHRNVCSDECYLSRYGKKAYLKARKLTELPEDLAAVWENMSDAEKSMGSGAVRPKKDPKYRRPQPIGAVDGVPIYASPNAELDAKLRDLHSRGETFADAQKAETLSMIPKIEIPPCFAAAGGGSDMSEKKTEEQKSPSKKVRLISDLQRSIEKIGYRVCDFCCIYKAVYDRCEISEEALNHICSNCPVTELTT